MVQSTRRTALVAPNDQQSAEYTFDMLIALKELAAARGQETLALLLNAAADEARAIARPRARRNGES